MVIILALSASLREINRQAGLSADRQASKLEVNMIIVYAIYDKYTREIYVGLTNDIERRISEHKRGQSRYTRKFKDIKLIYTEYCNDYTSARKREKYLKSGCGKEFLKMLI